VRHRFEEPEQVPVTVWELVDTFANNSKAGQLTLRNLLGGHTEQDLLGDGYEEPTPGAGGFYKWVGLQGRGQFGCELKRYFYGPEATESADGASFWPCGPKLVSALAHHLRKNGPFTMALWGWPDELDDGLLVLDGRFEVFFSTDRSGNNYVVDQVQSGLGCSSVLPHYERVMLTSPATSKMIKQVPFQRFVTFLHRSGLRLT
jgi:hypothetical protein